MKYRFRLLLEIPILLTILAMIVPIFAANLLIPVPIAIRRRR